MGKLVVTIGVGDQHGRQFEDLECLIIRSHSRRTRRTTFTSFLTDSRSLTPVSHLPLAIRWWSIAAFIISRAAMVQPSAWLLRLSSFRLSNPKCWSSVGWRPSFLMW